VGKEKWGKEGQYENGERRGMNNQFQKGNKKVKIMVRLPNSNWKVLN